MHGLETDKASIGGEAQIGVRTSQTGQSVERDTIDSHEDGRRETGFGVEFYPMNVVVV
jgi:hypothetical protein